LPKIWKTFFDPTIGKAEKGKKQLAVANLPVVVTIANVPGSLE